MTPDCEIIVDETVETQELASAPSASYIHAISEFFDTDPSDLLVELGYYHRTEDIVSSATDR